MLATGFDRMIPSHPACRICTEYRALSHELEALSSFQDGIEEPIKGDFRPTRPDYERRHAQYQHVHEEEKDLTDEDGCALFTGDSRSSPDSSRSSHRRGHQEILEQSP